ncbi:MAG: hypothetical protein A3J83_03845 [Elusimicrobia bacterium RIFOXYA2_FULL_40_6]|nr:MAG: hypothetical protein A3J83_03845 [Elusimicrobia bacterium RIFOXYA2_FULL_40_6]
MHHIKTGGKYIRGRILEVNLAYHCNLSCSACAHFSPICKKHFADPDKIISELKEFAKYYRADCVGLLGGEPLLHPEIAGIARLVKVTGITKKIRVFTNGLILWKMSDEFWKNVDEIFVSIYPGKEMSSEHLLFCKTKAKKFNVNLELLYTSYFRMPYTEIGTNNKQLTQRIYKTCQFAQRLNCYTLENGYFYKCPLALFIPMFMKNRFKNPIVDGIKATSKKDILDYLKSEEPLKSCKFCLGSVGKLFKHRQCGPANWRNFQKQKTEKLIDLEQLKILEYINPDEDFGCLKKPYPSFVAQRAYGFYK